MKGNKQVLIKAILTLAKSMGGERVYNELVKVQQLPELVNTLAYDLFVNDIDKRSIRDQDVYEAYMYVKDYATELSKQGFVKFENEPLESTEKL